MNKFYPEIKTTLETHYDNGFRIDSIIELSRFKRFYKETNNADITIDDYNLKETIKAYGLLHSGKVYCLKQEAAENIKNLIASAFTNGTISIYYDEFFEKYRDSLISQGITSSDLLKIFIKENCTNLYCKKNRAASQNVSSEEELLKKEILRVMGENSVISFDTLKENLPFIPIDKIKFFLAASKDFIRTRTGEYSYAENIELTQDEIQDLSNYITQGCAEKGWVSLAGYDFHKILERNENLTKQTIIDYFSLHYLEKKYKQNGKVISMANKNQNQYDIIAEYCREQDRISLNDLIAFWREMTESYDNRNCLKAAYDTLVRVNKNTFVNDKYIHFDVKSTDKAIAVFVTGGYLPIREITTFANFPFCGEDWNLYLLESYCIRFSGVFSFMCLVENSKNAGVIIRKGNNLSYIDILADALVKSGLPLEENTLVSFLYDKGYIASKSFKDIDSLITKIISQRSRNA